jgi:hypothetical protein
VLIRCSLTHWSHRTREQYEIRPSDSSNSGYISSSHSTKHRSRRDSESFSRRPEPISEYSTAQPLTIGKESSKIYHDPGGYDQAREQTYDSSNYDSPSGQRQYDNIASNTSGSYHQPTHHDWAQDPTVDSLTRQTNTLTINDVVGSSEYQVASTPQNFPDRGYDATKGLIQLPSMTDTGPAGYSTSQEVKGKGSDQSTYKAPRTRETSYLWDERRYGSA